MMGMKFWKKDDALGSAPGESKDPLGFDNSDLNSSSDNSFSSNNPSSLPSSFDSSLKPGQDTFSNPVFEQPRNDQVIPSSGSALEKDISILNAKLDAIKAMVDSINQRVMTIERIANESQTPKQTPQNQRPQTQQYRW